MRPADRELFIAKAESDTGFFARRVLGLDYDEVIVRGENGRDEKRRINAPHGGIRNNGPHLEMTQFLDTHNGKHKLLLAPRGSYKSSMAVALAIRKIIQNRRFRIFYGMYTKNEAMTKVMALRDTLVDNPIIKAMWGDLRGNKWTEDGFRIKGADSSAQTLTVEPFGVDKPKTGGHPDMIIGDDLVTQENTRTPEKMMQVRNVIEHMIPLLNPGSIIVLVGTLYDPGDAYHWLMGPEHEQDWEVLNIDSGTEMLRDEAGNYYLRSTMPHGGPRFPHITIEDQARRLRGMGQQLFSSQYLNRITQGLNQPFERGHFLPCHLSDRQIACLSGYVMMDTATSTNTDSCYSVIAYGGFDDRDRFYLLDLRVGKWEPDEVVRQYVGTLQQWSTRAYHRGEMLEINAANMVYQKTFEEAARAAGIRSNIIRVSRPASDANKEARILGLSPRFRAGKFFVNSTVRRTYRSNAGESVLWNPEGWRDPATGIRMPGGFLVDCFVAFPGTKERDIPDAFGDMDRLDNSGDRLCCFSTPRHVIEAAEVRSHQPLIAVASRIPRFGDRAFGNGQGQSWAARKLQGKNQ